MCDIVVVGEFFDCMQENKRNQSIITNSISTLNDDDDDALSSARFLSSQCGLYLLSSNKREIIIVLF
jgi:hypothetical protein